METKKKISLVRHHQDSNPRCLHSRPDHQPLGHSSAQNFVCQKRELFLKTELRSMSIFSFCNIDVENLPICCYVSDFNLQLYCLCGILKAECFFYV